MSLAASHPSRSKMARQVQPELCKLCNVDLLPEMDADVACSGRKTAASRTMCVDDGISFPEAEGKV